MQGCPQEAQRGQATGSAGRGRLPVLTAQRGGSAPHPTATLLRPGVSTFTKKRGPPLPSPGRAELRESRAQEPGACVAGPQPWEARRLEPSLGESHRPRGSKSSHGKIK